MVAVIMVGSLVVAATALLVIRIGIARAQRKAALASPPRARPQPVSVEIRLIPRRLNPVG